MKKATFILALMVALGLSIEVNAGPCERRCNTSSVTDDELTAGLEKCGEAAIESDDDDGGGEGGGGGRVDWCARLETCTSEFLELIPDCETEEIKFDGDNCRRQFKNCKSAKDIAPQINTLCANKQGCEMASCPYTGTEMPAESCPDGCPEWYDETDGGKCVPVSCEPICADDVVAEFKTSLPGFPIELLYALLGMVGLSLIFLIVLLTRKPKDEKKPAPKTAIVPPPADKPAVPPNLPSEEEEDKTTKVEQPSSD